MNYKMIRYTLGFILAFEAAFMLVPLLTALIFKEFFEFWMFLISAAICFAVGRLLIWKRPKNTTLYAKEGFIICSLCWIIISIFGAVPFVITGAIPNVVDAIFETVSGFTTTGSSILTSIRTLPRSVLIWRSFTHWVGGMGVLVFVMAFLPLAGGQNMHIMKAESPGPEVSKFVPKVRDTALILYGIYFGLTVLAFISYWISGMDFFEAINTAFSTAGTGGFSIRDDSCASLPPVQQWLIIIFMFLFGVNFNTYYLLLRKKIKDAFNAEVRVYTTFVILAISIISVNIYLQLSEFSNFGDAIRHAAFYVTALISTTGFATVDYNLWPTISHVVLMLALFMGACAGSTGGGFKVSRVMILLKGMKNEVQKAIHPRQIKRITMDKKPVDSEVVRNVNAFFVAYAFILVIGVFLISLNGKDITTSVTAVMTALSNVGPGLSQIGPVNNFAHFSDFSKIVLSFLMLAGRLELFPMIILLSPTTYKNKGF